MKFLQDFVNAKGIIVDEIIQYIGSGLNYNRKKWNNMIEEVMENKIDTVNNEFLSPQEELVQDII